MSVETPSNSGRVRKFQSAFWLPPRQARYEELLQKRDHFVRMQLEIGAGVGLHAIRCAQESPDTLLVALERTRNRFALLEQRVRQHDLPNLLEVHADAVPWVTHLDKAVKFSKIWILYPNPEPSNRNQRWVNSPFFPELLQRLNSEGELEFATNLSWYADEVERQAQEVWQLKVFREKFQDSPRTHFEKKYLGRGEVCWRLILTLC